MSDDDYEPMIVQLDENDIIDWKEAVRKHEEGVRDPESHRELDPRTFHPSYIGCCKRQGFIRKIGIGEPDHESLGVFRAGTIIHEYYEDEISKVLPNHVEFEMPFDPYTEEVDIDGETEEIKVVGRADCIDRRNKVVYDFKSRGGWYHFDGFDQKNLDQLLLYMRGFTGEEEPPIPWSGKLVYINKKKPTSPDDVRPYPQGEEEVFGFDVERFQNLMRKAAIIKCEVREYVRETEDGYELRIDKLREEGIPFDKCDHCYACNNDGERLIEELRDE